LFREQYAGWIEARDDLGRFVKRVYVDIDGRPFRVVGPKDMMNRKGVVIVTVSPDSPAAVKAIQRGDVLLEWGEDWKFFPNREIDKSVAELGGAMKKTRETKRSVVLFRNGASTIVQHDFEPGWTGITALSHLWPGDDLRNIKEAYDKFVAERRRKDEVPEHEDTKQGKREPSEPAVGGSPDRSEEPASIERIRDYLSTM